MKQYSLNDKKHFLIAKIFFMTVSIGTFSLVVGLALILSWAIISCKTRNASDKLTTQTISADSLTPSPEVHTTLSDEQIRKINKIYSAFSEVNPSTLEETISNFKRDRNPDNEIAIWLTMANTYNDFLATNPAFDLSKKQEVYKLIVLRSMMTAEEAKAQATLKLLTDKEANDILASYNKKPVPITVESK